jgi:hypothetical protein
MARERGGTDGLGQPCVYVLSQASSRAILGEKMAGSESCRLGARFAAAGLRMAAELGHLSSVTTKGLDDVSRCLHGS